MAETYRFPVDDGPITPVPSHAHESYQIGLTLTNPGFYQYRGARHAMPPHSLSVLHTGEAHAIDNARPAGRSAEFRLLYVPPTEMQGVAQHLGWGASPPFVRVPVVSDPEVVQRFAAVHRALMDEPLTLARDLHFLAAVTALLTRYGEHRPRRAARPDRVIVARVREQLHARYSENISLSELADFAEMGPFSLARMFRQVAGLAPHAYLLSVRVDRAKVLLAAQVPIAEVALLTGFAHQSHFGRHFLRLVGVTPGAYRAQRSSR